MVDGCVRRWQSRAALTGGRIELLWSGPDVLVRGDGVTLAAALENLIVNAIEHGGPDIWVTGRPVGKRVRIEVADNGIGGRAAGKARTSGAATVRTRRRGPHGHGLVVAERTACEHGGRLESEFSPHGSKATVILPQAGRGAGSSSTVKVNW
jgi:signal transduction histidine kinase